MGDQSVAADGQATRIGPALGLGSRQALGGLRRPLLGQKSFVDI